MLTRTDRRRFPVLLAVIAVLAMAMLVSPVQAKEGSAPGGSGTRANVSEPKGRAVPPPPPLLARWTWAAARSVEASPSGNPRQ